MVTKRLKAYHVAWWLAMLLATGACGGDPQPSRSTRNLSKLDDSLVSYNQEVVREEDRQIGDYLARYQWQVVVSQTGLRSMIYRHGSGKKAVRGATAEIGGTVRLLNGNLCYAFDRLHPKVVFLGHSQEERGLEEGIFLMREGDRAKFIVPSHLAFGLLGDQGRIPARAVLVYDIELLKVNESNK